MMRALVLFAGLFLTAAHLDMEEKGKCVIDGGEAVSEAMDASIYIWASVKRCGKTGEEVKCEVDMSSAVESVTQMIKIIMKTVHKCGKLHNGKCAIAATSLTRSVAGITASSGGIIEKCPNKMNPASNAAANWAHHNGALCIIDLKDTFKSLFKAIKLIMKTKKSCKHAHSRECTSNALHILGAFAGLGEFLAGSVGHCSHTATLANCGSEISGLIHHLTKVAATGTDMARHCENEAVNVQQLAGNSGTGAGVAGPAVPDADPTVSDVTTRLYEESDAAHGAGPIGINANIILGAFLPVTAIVSFVGGRFYANRVRMEQTREVMTELE